LEALFSSSHSLYSPCASKLYNMSGDNMDVEMAEAKLKGMEHSEQHYFKR
jgi:alpha/beta superfamily hydrolase